ncbi:UvrD-helicase domain-containing protein [Caulobacter segnis]|uniref:UvrD-helicase domain-containing protein n=1 Tax=Caulobacter segnis TaxID=88688 RepID=UPI0028651FCD|nr:UvrD-helicase domain-containing protein [Caulobacter segnis]MDR6624845.1 superfamily I DNA/RNA helicase [Caulobacter segnis]
MAGLVLIASAGSGKTTRLVSEAASLPKARILITTFTNENTDHIRNCLIERFGYVPTNITVSTWFSFLFSEGVRPYQNLASRVELSPSVALIDLPPVARFRRDDGGGYFFTSAGDIFRDRVSDFVCFADEKTGGRVVRRLEGIYSHIFIDELQDMAGYDLILLEKLFQSRIDVRAVGDPRQATYSTNRGQKNKGVARAKIIEWVEALVRADKVRMEELTDTWRSNQVICNFADALYPHLPKAVSKNDEVTDHDGVFEITPKEVPDYYAKYNPTILRWNRNSDTLGLPAMNIGISKGRTFDRVLIFPTNPMKQYLKKKDIAVAGDISKFYVATTRARYSVTFVV